MNAQSLLLCAWGIEELGLLILDNWGQGMGHKWRLYPYGVNHLSFFLYFISIFLPQSPSLNTVDLCVYLI